MTTFQATIATTRSPEDAFAYLARFSNAAQWDPSVTEARDASEGELGVGSAFDLVIEFSGRTVPVTYRITSFDAPRSVTLDGVTPKFKSHDVITVAPSATGSEVTYTATLTLTGVWRLAEPIAGRAFRKSADLAIAGLERELG
jgi:hypothetical protein